MRHGRVLRMPGDGERPARHPGLHDHGRRRNGHPHRWILNAATSSSAEPGRPAWPPRRLSKKPAFASTGWTKTPCREASSCAPAENPPAAAWIRRGGEVCACSRPGRPGRFLPHPLIRSSAFFPTGRFWLSMPAIASSASSPKPSAASRLPGALGLAGDPRRGRGTIEARGGSPQPRQRSSRRRPRDFSRRRPRHRLGPGAQPRTGHTGRLPPLLRHPARRLGGGYGSAAGNDGSRHFRRRRNHRNRRRGQGAGGRGTGRSGGPVPPGTTPWPATGGPALKRTLRLGMGVCQGRTCGPIVEDLLSLLNGPSRDPAAPWSARAPIKPVTLDALAEGGRS